MGDAVACLHTLNIVSPQDIVVVNAGLHFNNLMRLEQSAASLVHWYVVFHICEAVLRVRCSLACHRVPSHVTGGALNRKTLGRASSLERRRLNISTRKAENMRCPRSMARAHTPPVTLRVHGGKALGMVLLQMQHPRSFNVT